MIKTVYGPVILKHIILKTQFDIQATLASRGVAALSTTIIKALYPLEFDVPFNNQGNNAFTNILIHFGILKGQWFRVSFNGKCMLYCLVT
jgi:hypothetical protein